MPSLNPHTAKRNLLQFYKNEVLAKHKNTKPDQINRQLLQAALVEIPLEFLSFFSTPIFLGCLVHKAYLIYKDIDKNIDLESELRPHSGILRAEAIEARNNAVERILNSTLLIIAVGLSNVASSMMLSYFLFRTLTTYLNNDLTETQKNKVDGKNIEPMNELESEIENDYNSHGTTVAV